MIGVDPGPKTSGVVWWQDGKLIVAAEYENDTVLNMLRQGRESVAIEQIRGFGQTVGNETFDTCEMVGRMQEAAESAGCKVYKIGRKDIKQHICDNIRAQDKDVRAALIYKFGEVGTKKSPGPLFGVSGHCWAALAVAVTAYETEWLLSPTKEGHNAD